jgi:AcrR family transcriptional regulator
MVEGSQMGLREAEVPGRLRERKKATTHALLRTSALRLFKERGFTAVSVDAIAAEADVSRSTFFRYFGSKEAVLFNDLDESGDVFLAELRARPLDETPWQAFEEALVATSLDVGARQTPDERLVVNDLMYNDPALAGRRLKEQERWSHLIADVFAHRRGRSEAESEDRLAAATCIAVTEEVGRMWRAGPDSDPADLIRKSFGIIRTY